MYIETVVYGQFEYSVHLSKPELDCLDPAVEPAYFRWDIAGYNVEFELANQFLWLLSSIPTCFIIILITHLLILQVMIIFIIILVCI